MFEILSEMKTDFTQPVTSACAEPVTDAEPTSEDF